MDYPEIDSSTFLNPVDFVKAIHSIPAPDRPTLPDPEVYPHEFDKVSDYYEAMAAEQRKLESEYEKELALYEKEIARYGALIDKIEEDFDKLMINRANIAHLPKELQDAVLEHAWDNEFLNGYQAVYDEAMEIAHTILLAYNLGQQKVLNEETSSPSP